MNAKIPELGGNSFRSSDHRQSKIQSLPPPNDLPSIRNILSDQSDDNFPVFRNSYLTDSLSELDSNDERDYATTIATGIFDIKKRTWSIYTSPANTSNPIVVLPFF